VLKSGKYKFVKNLKSKLRKVTKKTKQTVRRKTRVARRKKRRRSRSMTIPLAPVLGLFAGLANPIQLGMAGQLDLAITDATFNYTGFNRNTGQFDIGGLARGMGPLILGLMVHKFVGGPPLNANKMLAAARVPVLRI